MKIWRMEEIGDIYQFITVKDMDGHELLQFVDSLGTKRNTSEWIPLKIQIHRNKRRKICDYPGFVVPVFSEKAVDVIRDFLISKADILPLDCGDERYFLINVYNKVDCIDYDQAQYTKFDSGRVREFKKYAFKQEMLINEHIFKIPEIIGKSMVFVSDEFRNRVINNDLIGFNFIEVWDSEE